MAKAPRWPCAHTAEMQVYGHLYIFCMSRTRILSAKITNQIVHNDHTKMWVLVANFVEYRAVFYRYTTGTNLWNWSSYTQCEPTCRSLTRALHWWYWQEAALVCNLSIYVRYVCVPKHYGWYADAMSSHTITDHFHTFIGESERVTTDWPASPYFVIEKYM